MIYSTPAPPPWQNFKNVHSTCNRYGLKQISGGGGNYQNGHEKFKLIFFQKLKKIGIFDPF